MVKSIEEDNFIIWILVLLISPFIALVMLGYEVFGGRKGPYRPF